MLGYPPEKLKFPHYLIVFGGIGLAKKKIKKKSPTKKKPKTKISNKLSLKIHKKSEFFLDNVDLADHLSKKFWDVIEKEAEHYCVVPIRIMICKCEKGDGEDHKVFYISYPTPKHYSKKKIRIETKAKVTKEDLEKLKKILMTTGDLNSE